VLNILFTASFFNQLAKKTNVFEACRALGIPRASYYRWQRPKTEETSKRTSPLALTGKERQAVLDVMHSERFIDKAPSEIYATLLDEGQYHCSLRTMYRILAGEDEVRERRQQRRTNPYEKPELLATKPNELWSWDITKLLGPKKWSYFHLYVILDVFSRYVVGWMVAEREAAILAEQLIKETCSKQNIQHGRLTLHADRGSSMKSKPVAFLLSDLGVTKTHSRPYTSDDNPYSESQFKTLKYCPQFPGRFGCIEDARAFCRQFFKWYNNEHRHSGIALLTPRMVHYGQAEKVLKQRALVLEQAYSRTPARFKYKTPQPGQLPGAVWINKPDEMISKQILEKLAVAM